MIRRLFGGGATVAPSLPFELWIVVLTDPVVGLDPRWRFCARRVCRAWNEIVESAYVGDDVSALARLEARGRLVRASVALVERCSVGQPFTPFRLVPPLRDGGRREKRRQRHHERVSDVVRWCHTEVPRASLPDVYAALLASNRADLVAHVIESGALAKAVADPEHHAIDAPSNGRTCRDTIYECVGRGAARSGNVDVALYLEREMDGFAVEDHCPVEDIVRGDNSALLDLVAERKRHRQGIDFCAHADYGCWVWSGKYGARRVLASMLMGATGVDPPDKCSDALARVRAVVTTDRRFWLDFGEAVFACMRAALMADTTCALDVLAEAGAIDDPVALAKHMWSGRSIAGIAWCMHEAYRLGAQVDVPHVLSRTVYLGPQEAYPNAVALNGAWDRRNAMSVFRWLCDPLRGNMWNAFDDPQVVASVVVSSYAHHRPDDAGCVPELIAELAPWMIRHGAVECMGRALAHVCRAAMVALDPDIAERLTAALDRVAGCVDPDRIALVMSSVNVWGVLVDAMEALLLATPRHLVRIIRMVRYILARVGGASCALACASVERSLSPPSSSAPFDRPTVATGGAWRSWWRPCKVVFGADVGENVRVGLRALCCASGPMEPCRSLCIDYSNTR